jgi:uncharacterized protein involved in exopolysaccharide biosynthesis
MQGRNFAYWVELLARRRTIAAEAGGAVLGLIALATLLWPPVYRSTAEILVQDNRAQYLVSPDLQVDGQAKQSTVAPITENDLNSEVELLTSTYLIKQALAGLPQPVSGGDVGSKLLGVMNIAVNLPTMGYDSLHRTPSISAGDAWALKLARHVAASPIKLSNIVEVSFTAHDPKWARVFLERLVDEYLDYHARISHDPAAERFFNQQAQVLQAQLYAAEDKLRQFELQTGISDVRAQTQALVNRLSDLQIQRARIGASTASAHEQVVSLEDELKDTPQQIGKETRSVQNVALGTLKPQLMQLKAERAELLARYQPNSQRIQEIDAKIAAAQEILNREDHLEVQEKSVDLNPVWVSLDTGLEQAKTAEASDHASLTALSSQLDALHRELNQMTTSAVQLERLQRRVASDKEAYLSYVRKSEEARTAQALNINKILNVSIAQPPSAPLEPIFPAVWLNLLAGMVVAIIVGFLAAYWEEWQDDRIFSPTAIAEVSGLNTVAIVRDEA